MRISISEAWVSVQENISHARVKAKDKLMFRLGYYAAFNQASINPSQKADPPFFQRWLSADSQRVIKEGMVHGFKDGAEHGRRRIRLENDPYL